jgi:uncharacterized surface protein with fasciclin (FAS1) repeats
MQTTVTTIKNIIFGLGLLMLSSCLPEISDTGYIDEEEFSISEFLDENQDIYSKFREIVIVAGQHSALNAYNPWGDGFTLFLPDDKAVDRYIAGTDKYGSFNQLLEDVSFCNSLVLYHLVNKSIRSVEFPFGALPDSTASGDYLAISFEVTEDTSIYKVNNSASITVRDIEVNNGIVNEIDNVLEPIVFSSFDWLKNNPDFSIISGLFEITNLKDTMGVYVLNSDGVQLKNTYTILAEPDSIYRRNGISDLNDLIERYGTPGLDPENKENGLYQFAAYHILEGQYYLDAFEGSRNYNTYSSAPVAINAGISIRINTGVDTFNIVVSDENAIYITYIEPFYTLSNINTKSGVIHLINQVMEYYVPSRSKRTFQFLEDPLILSSSKNAGTYEFVDPEAFTKLHWEDADRLVYEKFSTDIKAMGNDYIMVEGDFLIEYTLPKIMQGVYEISLRIEATNPNNANIQLYVDGQKVGSNFDLTSGGTSSWPFFTLIAGTIEFSSYETHTVTIKSLIPGILKWDAITLTPISY